MLDLHSVRPAVRGERGAAGELEALTIDAASTIRLLELIEALYPMLVLIHVFLDNARYHHAKLVREWLARPGCRIKLHFIPPYCPHLNPIERLWGLMHRNVTHNKCYATCGQFADATLDFLCDKVPKNWRRFRDLVIDNFRVINPKDFWVVARTGYNNIHGGFRLSPLGKNDLKEFISSPKAIARGFTSKRQAHFLPARAEFDTVASSIHSKCNRRSK